MSIVVLDANAVISHGRVFAERARLAVDRGDTLVLPRAVKRELVDEVLDGNPPANHRRSAETIQTLVDDDVLDVRDPDIDRYGAVIDEARRRIADETLPEHHVGADRYIPAIVCELATERSVTLVTGDRKLSETVRVLAEKRGVADTVSIAAPHTVL
jgi:hypothetical protein